MTRTIYIDASTHDFELREGTRPSGAAVHSFSAMKSRSQTAMIEYLLLALVVAIVLVILFYE
jgi:hypothetical protein